MDVSQTPTVKVSYRLTQRDFYDALIARRNRRSTAAAPYFLIGIAVVMLILGLVTYFTGNNPQVVRSVVIPSALFCSGAQVFGVSLGGQHENSFRANRSLVEFEQPHSITQVFTGIGTAVTETSFGCNYIGYLETKQHFLLYSSPAIVQIVPKRDLDAEQLRELRLLITANVPPMK